MILLLFVETNIRIQIQIILYAIGINLLLVFTK